MSTNWKDLNEGCGSKSDLLLKGTPVDATVPYLIFVNFGTPPNLQQISAMHSAHTNSV